VESEENVLMMSLGGLVLMRREAGSVTVEEGELMVRASLRWPPLHLDGGTY
jgi:hypothetical protein